MVAASVGLAACGSGEREWRVVETIEGRDSAVMVEYAPSETFPGMADIRVRMGEGPGSILYEASIAEAGGEISVNNIRPDARRSGYLWMCLNSPEQQDVVVRIDLVTRLVVEEQRFCAE